MRVNEAVLGHEPRQPTSGPLAPRIGRGAERMRGVLVTAYQQAYRWALGAHQWLGRLLARHDVGARWNVSPAARLFGPYQPARARRVFAVLEGLLQRFRHGYRIEGRQVPATLVLFPASYGRCRNGLLGNANILGTVRLCPQLLGRGPVQTASVVFHELMHQGLDVDDQRHPACDGSKNRCYREGARELVRVDRHDLAVRNIDNYVAFARMVAGTA
jgi:hypothetical protein